MRLVFALILAALVLAACPARAEQGPREIVRDYMNALKTRDYKKALQYVGLEAPAEVLRVLSAALTGQRYFTWAVRDFQITDVRQDGGLAVVTVEETHFMDVDADTRSYVADRAPALSRAIHWGDNVVVQRFVLIRLDGRWQFDSTHSAVQTKSIVNVLTRASQTGGFDDPTMQKEIASFINGLAYGQLLQSVAAAGPVLPVVAAVLVPNFVRAKAQGQATACKSNLKNIGTGLEMYSTDYSGRFPPSLSLLKPNYLRDIPTCPAAQADTYSASYTSSINPDAYTVVCGGHHHREVGYSTNYPQYNSVQGVLER